MVMPANTVASFLETWSSRLTESERALSLRQIEVQDARLASFPKTASLINSDPDTNRNSTPGSWDAKIYELTQEMTAVDEVRVSLKRELDLAHVGRCRAQNSLAGVSRIPDTVLADIFFVALTSCNAQGRHALLRAISSTSYFWRVLALNTPKLWCDIVIRDCASDLSRTLAYLDRSADALLNFTIVATPHDRIESMEMHELLQWTAPYLQRCKTLTIVTSEYEDARSLLPIKYPMPRLRRFTWAHTGAERPPASDAPIIILDGSASSPASVHVHTRVGSDMSYSFRLGTSKLAIRNLSFEGGDVRTMTELMEELPTYPKLRSLLLALNHVDLQAEELGLRSDSLEVIRVVPSLNIPHIFDHMDTPRLKHLVLSRSLSPVMGIQGDIGPFPHLRTLWFETGWFSASNLRQIIKDHPTLEAIGSSTLRAMLPVVRILAQPATLLPSTFSLPCLSSLRIIYRDVTLADSPLQEWRPGWDNEDMPEVHPPMFHPPFGIRQRTSHPIYPQAEAIPTEMCRALKALLQNRLKDHGGLEICLNWPNLAHVPQPFETLALEHPNSVSLSGDPLDYHHIPHLFFPV